MYALMFGRGACVSRLLIFVFALTGTAQGQEPASPIERERLLLERVERLERRLAELETQISRKKVDPPVHIDSVPSVDVIRPVPSGRLHVLDTYHTFTLNDKWTLAVEGDYVAGRVFRDSPPSTVCGGAGYARYQWTLKFGVAGRLEYLIEKVSPAGGLFSGVNQALKEHTLTAEYKFADGFLGRLEYRRDFSNQPSFLTEQPGIQKKEQNTATLGLVWWLGRKEGSW